MNLFDMKKALKCSFLIVLHISYCIYFLIYVFCHFISCIFLLFYSIRALMLNLRRRIPWSFVRIYITSLQSVWNINLSVPSNMIPNGWTVSILLLFFLLFFAIIVGCLQNWNDIEIHGIIGERLWVIVFVYSCDWKRISQLPDFFALFGWIYFPLYNSYEYLHLRFWSPFKTNIIFDKKKICVKFVELLSSKNTRAIEI